MEAELGCLSDHGPTFNKYLLWPQILALNYTENP